MSGPSFGRLTDAPATLLIAGARVIDPGAGTDRVGDVGVREGVIVDAATLPAGAARVDGTGMVLAPGFVDLHTHLREPGGESAETVESGSRAAARGGFTTICAMPNTDPAVDAAERVAWVVARGADAACQVRVIAAVTAGRAGADVADLAAMASAGAVAVSDDGSAVSASTVRAAMTAAAEIGLPLIEHAEDAERAAGSVMRAGRLATRLGLAGWPADAEARIVERDIAVAEETGARLHLTHVSTRGTVDAVRAAKARGVRVTADVTPHHLAMSDEWVAGSRRFAWVNARELVAVRPGAYDGCCRVNPPLGPLDDARALMDGLRDGTIDAIATDHAPHPAERKLVPFGEAAPGVIGLETALSVGLSAVESGALDLATLLASLSTRPARVIGETPSLTAGALADLVLFDPRATWRVDRSTLHSRSANTPLLGLQLPGVVHLTIAAGRVTYRS